MDKSRAPYLTTDIDQHAVNAWAVASARAQDSLLYDVDGEKMSAAEAAYRVYQQRNELRTILAPILSGPCRWHPVDLTYYCLLCDQARDDAATHAPDCPTRAAARLLGRTPAGTG